MSRELRDCCVLKGGSGFPEKYQGSPEGEIPFIKVSDMNLPGNERFITTANHYVSTSDAKLLHATIFNSPSIVFAKVGAALLLNRRRIVLGPTIIDNNMMAATPSNIDAAYLYHFLCAVDFGDLVQNGALPSVNQSQIGAIKVPSLPAPNQKKIAAILTAADTAIEKTEALITKYQQIKSGLMHALLTRGVLPDGQLRPQREHAPDLYAETAIGWIPKEWRVSKLGTMARIVSGVTLGAKESPLDTIEAPYLRVANVQDGYLDLSEIKTVRVSRQTLDFLRLHRGDVLMNEGGDFDKLGRGAVWTGEIEDCVHQNHVFRVRTDASLIMPDFLALYSESSFGKKYFLLSSKQSTNLASINSTQLNAYPIALPSLLEQSEIVRRLICAKRRIESLEAEAHKLRSQKSGLMQDLLTGNISVKVTMSDSQEEATS